MVASANRLASLIKVRRLVMSFDSWLAVIERFSEDFGRKRSSRRSGMPFASQERLKEPRCVDGSDGSGGMDMNSVLHTRWNSSMQELCQEKGALVFKAAKPRGTRLSADHTGSVRWLGECLTLYLLLRDAPSSNVRAQKRRSTAPRITSHPENCGFKTPGSLATTRERFVPSGICLEELTDARPRSESLRQRE